ncbi:MAG TPA: permease [bacterium]|nr:permease [bacterium]HNS48993.1 permease [bacterium]
MEPRYTRPGPRPNRILIIISGFVALYLVNLWMSGELYTVNLALKNPRLQLFGVIMTAILLEGFPFLLLGSCISGAIEVLVPREVLEKRLFSANPIKAAAVGSLLGMAFPVCSCGNIPVTRRLMSKGVPVAGAVSYLLAAPIINPITLFSTIAAFPQEKTVVIGRLTLAFIIANIAGLCLGRWKPGEILKAEAGHDLCPHEHHHHDHSGNRLGRILSHAESDFFLTGRYLIMGASVAALFQTFIPRTAVNALAANSLLSVFVMELMGIAFSLCSFADAFVASTFTALPAAAKTGFMVAGPMTSLALVTLYLGTFQRKFAGRLIMITAAGVLILASVWALLSIGG